MHVTALIAVAACILPVAVAASEIKDETLQAYREYVHGADRRFAARCDRDRLRWVDDSPDAKRRAWREEVVVDAAEEDGIIDVPGGLIHNWTGVIFIRGARLKDVLRVSQAYGDYQRVYEPVMASRLIGRKGDTYRIFMRLKRKASVITAVLDTWTTITYSQPRADRAYAVSEIEKVSEVKDAGTSNERRLPPGEGSGYLWHGRTFSRYLERDGGVYVELETLGLSREFPLMLGWIIEPIARSVGKGSVQDSLEELRRAVLDPRPAPVPGAAAR